MSRHQNQSSIELRAEATSRIVNAVATTPPVDCSDRLTTPPQLMTTSSSWRRRFLQFNQEEPPDATSPLEECVTVEIPPSETLCAFAIANHLHFVGIPSVHHEGFGKCSYKYWLPDSVPRLT